MKKLFAFLVLFVSMQFAFGQLAQQTLLIDFGTDDVSNGNITTSPDINGNYWSNVTSNEASGVTADLLNTQNTATVFTFEILSRFDKNGINHGGLLAPSAALLGNFAVNTATQDYFFTTSSAKIKISGLAQGKSYKFTMFGSRNFATIRTSRYILTGNNTSEGTLQTSGTDLGGTGYHGNNSSKFVSEYVQADAEGKIILEVKVETGGFAYLNVMQMEEFDLRTTPSITWANPADIVYGTALSATQLNASANVSGTFAYNPASGTVLNAANNQILTVNFTPTDAQAYFTTSAVALINVKKATPTITWANPADIDVNTALSSNQLNATANVSGTFAYIPAWGTVLSEGANQILTVNFTPSDVANYNLVSKTVVINVIDSSPLYLDPNASVDERVEDLLARMTLAEKIGQMTQAEKGGIESSNLEDLKTYFIGSVLSGGGSVPNPNTVDKWVEMYNNMQNKATSTRLQIPILYGIDAVHGHNNLLNGVIFPHNIGLGCTRDAELVKECARITALEIKATGLDWTFSPCVAVVRNERWGRTYEGFSENSVLVDEMGKASVLGYQSEILGTENFVLGCAKHFIGDGGTTNGVDQGNTQITESELRSVHLPPYISAIDAGVGTVMASYNSWNGVKCHGNKQLLTDVLKTELGFNGFVISDWKGIDQLNGDFKTAIKIGINAGVDMAMQPDNYVPFIQFLTELVNSGDVPMSRIDDAVRRILRIKFQMGLFEHHTADLSLKSKVGSSEHREVARQAVRKSLVLLKNNGILPFSKTTGNILIAGAKGKDIGAMCGGWSITWQGKLGEITEGTSIYEGVLEKIGSARTLYTDNSAQIPTADFAIVVVGENPYAESAGDIATAEKFGLSADDKAMIQAVKTKGIPFVVVLLSGRPLDIQAELTLSNAFVAAWLPGTEGGSGIADVLFGDYVPTGKLSHTWVKSFSDIPMNVNADNSGKEALFAYDFGLTYTNVGIENQISLHSNLKIFPNPASEYIVIQSDNVEIQRITLADVTGKIHIQSTVPSTNNRLSISGLSSGIYILTVTTAQGSISKKVVKE